MRFIEIKGFSFLLFFIAVFTVSCDTSRNVDPIDHDYFLKYYGEDGNQEAVDMIVNSDGTFILLGNSTESQQRILVVKVDSDGGIIWQRKLGTSTDIPKDIETTLDGNYVILSDFQNDIGNTDIKLIKVNQDGIKTDSVTRGTPEDMNETSRSVTTLNDGGFIVTGTTDYDWKYADSKDRNSSFLHYRFNSDFSDLSSWSDYTGSGKNNFGVKSIQEGDNLYLFGYSDSKESNDNPNDKILLTYYSFYEPDINSKLISFGDINKNNEGVFLTKTPSELIDGYLFVSTTNKSQSPRLRVSKLKNPLRMNLNDDKQFDLNISGAKRLEAVNAAPSLTLPLGYLIVSNEITETNGSDILLTKIDQSGTELWSINYGAGKDDKAAAVVQLADGKIMLLCTIESALQKKMALLKLNSKGQLLN